MPPAYAERVNAPAARFWLARKAGAHRVTRETPELDDVHSSERRLGGLLLWPWEGAVSAAPGNTPAARPIRKRDPPSRSRVLLHQGTSLEACYAQGWQGLETGALADA